MIMETQVRDVFVDKKALWSVDAAPQQLDEVLVVNLADQINFIEKMFYPLHGIEHKPLYCHRCIVG